MTSSIQQLIENRNSINHFQPKRPVTRQTIATLVNLATKAPSAYNMQNWRFIAVQSEAAKTRLQSAAFGQQKIADAAVVFVICGTLTGHTQLAKVLQASVCKRIIEQRMLESWVAQATAAMEHNPVLQRDEAIRSASLAAMTMILAAEGMGLDSCAIGGFDAAHLALEFSLGSDEIPVVLVAVGHAAHQNSPQKIRRPLSQILTIV